MTQRRNCLCKKHWYKLLNIKIPKILLKSQDHKIALIRGVYDTDGTLYLEPRKNKLYPRIHISTISQVLAKQLHKILLNLRPIT